MRETLPPIVEEDEPDATPPPNRHRSTESPTSTQAWDGFEIIPVSQGARWQSGARMTSAFEEEGNGWDGFDIIPTSEGGYYLGGTEDRPAWNGFEILGANDDGQLRYEMRATRNSSERSVDREDDENMDDRGDEDMGGEDDEDMDRKVDGDEDGDEDENEDEGGDEDGFNPLEEELDNIMDGTFIQELLKGDPHSPVTRLDIQRFLIGLSNKKQSTERGANTGKLRNGPNNCCDPVPRDDDRKLLQALVRFHMAVLMERATFRSTITVAVANSVKAFSLRRGEGPTLKPMKPHLTGKTIHSPWNNRLKDLFVDDFLRIGWANRKDAPVVAEMFFTHLIHLRRYYQAQLLAGENGGELTQAQRDDARDIARVNRRRTLRDRRADICRGHPELRQFAPLWDNIPYLAVSDEEEDYEDGRRRLIALGMPWRSAQAEEWMVRLDHVHMSTRWNSKGKPKRGKLPRWRVRGSKRMEASSEPPCGLPENFYDALWLNELMEEDRQALKTTKAVKLDLSDKIMKISAQYRNVRDRSTPPNLNPYFVQYDL